jgi:hypothetical protein
VTILSRLSRGIVERLRGIYYEGPEPPGRLAEMAVAFANQYPHATRGEWVRFCGEHAGECYRSGYVRGVERAERDYERSMPERAPEDVADELDPDWRWSPDITLLGDHDAEVLHELDEQQLTAQEISDYNESVIERNRRREP